MLVIIYVLSSCHLYAYQYSIVQNGGREKLWQIWSSSPKFYPSKFMSQNCRQTISSPQGMNTQQILKLVGNMLGQVSAPISSPFGPHINKQLAHKLVGPCMTTLQPMYLLDYSVHFYKKVMLHHKEHSKHLYIRGVPSPHLTLRTHAHTI